MHHLLRGAFLFALANLPSQPHHRVTLAGLGSVDLSESSIEHRISLAGHGCRQSGQEFGLTPRRPEAAPRRPAVGAVGDLPILEALVAASALAGATGQPPRAGLINRSHLVAPCGAPMPCLDSAPSATERAGLPVPPAPSPHARVAELADAQD
jgi:hypothetical protein